MGYIWGIKGHYIIIGNIRDPVTSVFTCRPPYCFRRTCGKNVLGTKVLGNEVPERTTNFGWPALQQVRDLCLSSPFLLLPIFYILK